MSASTIAWLDWPFAVALDAGALAFSTGWAWRMRTRGASPWPALVASALLPVFAPSWMFVRIVATVLAVTTGAKVWMVHRGAPTDPAMAATLPRFVLWFIIPPDATWPADDAARAHARGKGRHRGLRGALKLPPLAGLYALHVVWPPLHDSPWLEAFWALWVAWLGMSATADLVTAVLMQWGLDFEEMFDTPPLADSPRDFWGRRWNLFVHRFAARFLFLPLGGRRHPMRATFGVFLCSGVMHEYFILGCTGGVGRHTGFMMVFFVLHGAGVVLEMALRRRRRGRTLPRPVAIAMHVGWLALTGPLFFMPLREVFAGW
jgi:hypothetical protein